MIEFVIKLDDEEVKTAVAAYAIRLLGLPDDLASRDDVDLRPYGSTTVTVLMERRGRRAEHESPPAPDVLATRNVMPIEKDS